MVKTDDLHLRISSKYRDFLKQYVSLRRVRGKKITESKVVEAALKYYGIEEKCMEEHAKLDELFKAKK